FAADVGAVPGVRVHLVAEVRTEDVLAEITRRVGLLQGLLVLLVHFPDLAVDVVVARGRGHRVAGDDHALDHRVRVVAQEVPVLARARLALVRIAYHVFRARELARHERPLQAGGEAGATAAAQRRLLEIVDEIFRFGFGFQNTTQSLVTVARLVVL